MSDLFSSGPCGFLDWRPPNLVHTGDQIRDGSAIVEEIVVECAASFQKKRILRCHLLGKQIGTTTERLLSADRLAEFAERCQQVTVRPLANSC